MTHRKIWVLVPVVSLILVGSLLASTSVQAETNAWRSWAVAGKPAIKAIATTYGKILVAVKADNSAMAKKYFMEYSNDAVAVASVDNSPSRAVNLMIVHLGRTSNAFAWSGYKAVLSPSASNVQAFKVALAANVADENALTKLLKPVLQ